MSDLKQQYDYDCGPAAIRYLMTMRGVWYRSDNAYQRLIKESGAQAPDGTSHENMEQGLKWAANYCYNLPPETWTYVGPIERQPLFSIVNYQLDGEGHYGVLVGRQDVLGLPQPGMKVFIWDPYTGSVQDYWSGDFNKLFYSDRFPPAQWSISLV